MSQPSTLQLDLFAAPLPEPGPAAVQIPIGPPAGQGCSGCGRPEEEAPIHVINDRGRFCIDCEAQALAWPGPERPYVAGGPAHARPWSNPALASGHVRPSGARPPGRRPA
jgi:hypothetical protein